MAGIVVGLALALPAGRASAAEEPAALRVHLTGIGGARLVGDHETVTTTICNAGVTALHDVLLMLSLLDVTTSTAVPQGIEDWTPHPEAVHAATLAPGAELTATWKLRMTQAGQLAIFATAVAGSTRSVINSQPIVLSIATTRHLTPMTVLPVAIGVPLALLGGSGALFWHRYRIVSR